jgi:alpha-glucoside transport system substrate-binding protein
MLPGKSQHGTHGGDRGDEEHMNRTRHTRIGALATAALLLVAACGGNGDDDTPAPGGGATGGAAATPTFSQIGGSVSVLGVWSGSEQDSFLAMVKPWEEKTGAKVNYTGSRDLQAQLTTGIASGNLPDLAGLPGPGLTKEWYDQGALKPMDFVNFESYAAATPPGFADLGKAEDGKLIGIFTKATVKGLVWYNPKTWTAGAPKTYDELKTAATSAATGDTKTWCIGVESGAASGWPGTDWIEDIVLRQSGPDVYDKWVKGEQKWTSPEIKQAWETFGEVLTNSHGGSQYVVNTAFGKAANPMFAATPGCLFHHQASFITDFFKNEAGAKEGDFDFFPFPDINPQFSGAVTGAGDLFGMFKDTPQSRSLVQWLLTPEAQEIWVKRGGFISGNKAIAASIYPDKTSQKSAEILQQAKTFRFDASDQFPGAMNDAFFKAIVQFAQNPGQLDSILSSLDQTQTDAYQK